MPAARDVNRPAVDEQRAAELAAELFGIGGAATALPSERDRNFLIEGDERFVLKIAHVDTELATLVAEARCVEHVAAGTSAIDVPRPVATVDGGSITSTALDGVEHFVRLVEYLPGRPLGVVRPKTKHLLGRLGEAAGTVLRALDGYVDATVRNDFAWDVRSAGERVETLLPQLDAERRAFLAAAVTAAQRQVASHRDELRTGVIHGDLNDHNVIVGDRIGLIDFGDVHESYRIAEVAIAAAYAAFGFDDPVEVLATVAAGADRIHPLEDAELAAIVPLAMLRLGVSVAMAAEQMVADPANEYLAISNADAWQTLRRLTAVPPRLAVARVREACGRRAVPISPAVVAWVQANQDQLHSPLGLPLDEGTTTVIDWSVASPMADHPKAAAPMEFQIRRTVDRMAEQGALVGLGRYGEPRLVYAAPEFAEPTNEGPGARTVHLGVDLSCPPGTEVMSMSGGTVHRVEVEALEGGYGPVVTLRHEPDDGPEFFTLYGHLEPGSTDHLDVGAQVGAGAVIGRVGVPPENGNWPPHLHFQLIADDLDLDGPFPGVALPQQWPVWSELSPSPAAALGLPAAMVDAPHPDEPATLEQRRRLLPPSLSTSYETPLVAVRGFGAYLYDGWGRQHLDCVNNVAHVGHEHPYVVAALTRQAKLLNTNSRYPHPERVRYLERLLALFPARLDTAFLVCSGSEANDLALRIARTVTGREAIVVLEGAYHGHTGDLIAASPYKHDGPGGGGRPPRVHVAPLPDPHRHPERTGLDDLTAALDRAGEDGGAAAFIAESLPGVAGQIEPPPGWLRQAFEAARHRGALTIADEVQVGMGRLGTHWWGFERDGAAPDIVTLGKPLGNGHPMAAVVTSRAVAEAFATGMEYFNTFGGNPVSCAVGNAVLDVMESEDLRHTAGEVGGVLLRRFGGLAESHTLIGDVRGAGMFLGVELVNDHGNKEPAAAQAHYVVERARAHGVLLSVDGLHHNVLKFKPPLAFALSDADRLTDVLDAILSEDPAQPV